jgi:hypothetical protein
MWTLSNRLKQLLFGIICTLFFQLAFSASWEHPKLSRPGARHNFENYKAATEVDSAFKVFVMSPIGASSWRVRSTFEQALKDALGACQGGTSADNCQLFAVGNTIVWDMSRSEQERIISEYKAGKLGTPIHTTAPLNQSGIRGFGSYRHSVEGKQFKVFMFNERSGSWAYRMRASYEEAVRDATSSCEEYSRQAGDCRLFAVGDTIVWDMTEKERAAAIHAYRKKAQD